MNTRHALCAILAAGTVLSCSTPALALTNISDWAQAEVRTAVANKLEPELLARKAATGNITREEFCEVVLRLYEAIAGTAAKPSSAKPFTDTDSAAVASAYALGLVSGRTATAFAPTKAITRQELCVMLNNVLTVSGCTLPPVDPESIADFADRASLESWAVAPVDRMLSAGILRGTASSVIDATGERTTVTLLSPRGTTTREQALLLALRTQNAFARPAAQSAFAKVERSDAMDPEGSGSPSSGTPSGGLGAGGTPSGGPDASGSPSVGSGSSGSPSGSMGVGDFAPSSPMTEEEKMLEIFGAQGYLFETPELALAAMTEIEVPVWRLQADGTKKSGKAFVVVNTRLSPLYIAIFNEIYQGSEQFPIADIGSYAWRPTPTSEHRWGTAIDLNADANMECRIDEAGVVTQITSGTHWTPGVDPLSIAEDGEVYRAFTKYGFSWGGNAWKGKRDYMHFSYFGR